MYVLIFLVLLLVALLSQLMPFTTMRVNAVQVKLKTVLLCLLVFITIFIDTESLPMDKYRDNCGYIFLGLMVGVVSYVFMLVVRKVPALLRGKATSLTQEVRAAYDLK